MLALCPEDAERTAQDGFGHVWYEQVNKLACRHVGRNARRTESQETITPLKLLVLYHPGVFSLHGCNPYSAGQSVRGFTVPVKGIGYQ